MTNTRFITVLTAYGDSVPAYLYSHTVVVSRVDGSAWGRSRSAFLLRTEGYDGDDGAVVERMAQYQADRLSSGLHGARVHPTLAVAEAYLETELQDLST